MKEVGQALDRFKERYDPIAATNRLRREAEERVWERTPRKRLARTRQGVLYEIVEVSEDELPEFIRGGR